MPRNLFDREANPGLLMHEWTKNHRPPAGAPPVPTRPPLDGWPTAHRLSVLQREALQPDLTSTHDCLTTFARRRSIRHYATTPLTAVELANLLALAVPVTTPPTAAPISGDPAGGAALVGPTSGAAQVGPRSAASQAALAAGLVYGGLTRVRPRPLSTRLFPILQSVEGLPAGAYYHDATEGRLERLHDEHPRPMLERLCYQAEFHLAPVVLILAGSLSGHLASHGDRGYRTLMFDAGIMIQRLYLATAALGLVGSTAGSLFQEQAGQWLGLDSYHGLALMAFAVGHPLPATTTDRTRATATNPAQAIQAIVTGPGHATPTNIAPQPVIGLAQATVGVEPGQDGSLTTPTTVADSSEGH